MSNNHKIKKGITEYYTTDQRCDRCDYPLKYSKYENINLVYSRGHNEKSILALALLSAKTMVVGLSVLGIGLFVFRKSDNS